MIILVSQNLFFMKTDEFYFIVGVIIVLMSWYFVSPLFFIIGLLIGLSNGINLLFTWNNKSSNSDKEFRGCMFVIPIIISIIIASFFWNKKCHVSAFGDKQHIYGDCDYRLDKRHDYKMIQLSAYFYGCFSKCEHCKVRKEYQLEQKRKENEEQMRVWMIQKHKSDISFIESQIEELQDILEVLKNGDNSIDVSEYEFRKDIEDEIRESIMQELEDSQEYEDAQWEPRGRY